MRKIATALLLVGTLVVGLLFLVPTLMSTDWVRSELGRQLSSGTGMTIRLEGPVSLSFLPRLAVVAEDISLATGEGDVSVTVPRFSTAITVSSLWSDKLEIQAISLVNPAIALKEADETSVPRTAPRQGRADPFASIVDTLERLAVKRITIENGSLAASDPAGTVTTVSAIDVDLRVPDLDREAAFSLAATKDGRRAEISGTLSALRPVLKRLPAEIAIEARLEPAPLPEFSSLGATGEIRLNDNGSYQIRDGQFDIGEQSFRLDALFRPGERHQFFADLTAKRIDIAALAGVGQEGNGQDTASADAGDPDLLMLSAFDADISVAIEELVSGEIMASDVQLAATLRDGRLEAKLDHLGLEAGSVAATISTSVRETPPTIQGKIVSSGLDIGSMAKLLGQPAPLSGKMTVDAGFAFRGLTERQFRSSANLRGAVGIRDGRVSLAGLRGTPGGPVEDITGLNLDVEVDDVSEPVRMAGDLVWRGQSVALQSQVAAQAFLSSGSFADASGPVSLSISSKYLEASADGLAGASGTFRGKFSAASPSVDKLVQWLAQTGAESLRDFTFEGDVEAGPGRLSFQKAALALNGVAASGEGSVELGTPLEVRTALKFDNLDFAALAGGERAVSGQKRAPDAAADLPVDFSFLRGLDATVEIEAQKIGYGEVVAGPLTTTLAIAAGTARLTVPQSPFHGGTVAAKMVADGSADVPSLELEATVGGAAAAALLGAAAGFDRIEGALDTKIAVSGAGNTTKSLARSLNGNATIRVHDGALRGIDIADVYNNLVGLLSKGFEQDESKETAFTELGASFAIEGGVARTQDISLLGPLVRMEGSGKVDLAERTLEVNLDPRIVASLTGQGGDIAAQGIGVPVVVEGPLSGPRIYPDLSSLLNDPKGALETLGRLGLPTGKLDLDQLIPGQLPSGSGGADTGVADVIGDLINGAPKDGGDGSGLTDIIDDALVGGVQNSDRPATTETRDAESAAKAIIGDLLDGGESEPAGTTDGTATQSDAATEPEAIPGSDHGEAGQETSTPTAADSAAAESQAPAETPEEGGIGSLLDNLLR